MLKTPDFDFGHTSGSVPATEINDINLIFSKIFLSFFYLVSSRHCPYYPYPMPIVMVLLVAFQDSWTRVYGSY